MGIDNYTSTLQYTLITKMNTHFYFPWEIFITITVQQVIMQVCISFNLSWYLPAVNSQLSQYFVSKETIDVNRWKLKNTCIIHNSIQDTKLVGIRNNCQLSSILHFLPVYEICLYFIYQMPITIFLVVQKPYVYSSYQMLNYLRPSLFAVYRFQRHVDNFRGMRIFDSKTVNILLMALLQGFG